MERKDLETLGLDDKQTTEVMKLYNAGIEPIKQQVADTKSELDSVKQQVVDRDGQIKSLGEQAGNSEKLNKQIATLQETIKTKDSEAAASLTKVKTDNAVQMALRDAKARDAKAIMPFIDMDTVKLGDDGQLTGIGEQIEKLQESHEYLFDKGDDNGGKTAVKITAGGNPSGGGNGKTKLSDMTLAEQGQLYREDRQKWEELAKQ
ncbi:phage scaffolding protein [Lactiplantibacillus plantarum]|uniref:phage scaffolding protein n=1 Tax=Lactiplantibacillus plantarum TaxID=1590 RepID=UPI00240E0D67|nr:phage scaffolding protein [Lactiplantibacillus plantarum]MDG2544738.1 phage scaffolding protein [Lactiplantibacillus plantarum]